MVIGRIPNSGTPGYATNSSPTMAAEPPLVYSSIGDSSLDPSLDQYPGQLDVAGTNLSCLAIMAEEASQSLSSMLTNVV